MSIEENGLYTGNRPKASWRFRQVKRFESLSSKWFKVRAAPIIPTTLTRLNRPRDVSQITRRKPTWPSTERGPRSTSPITVSRKPRCCRSARFWKPAASRRTSIRCEFRIGRVESRDIGSGSQGRPASGAPNGQFSRNSPSTALNSAGLISRQWAMVTEWRRPSSSRDQKSRNFLNSGK
jgi:hypothetical protein